MLILRPGDILINTGKMRFVKPCDNNIKETLQLVDALVRMADKGDADREDTGCGILYGTMRDSAYKIKKLAEKEKKAHIEKGWWK